MPWSWSPPSKTAGDRVARNAEYQQGDQGAADNGVVGRLRSHDALNVAGAEGIGAGRVLLGLVVGHEIGQGAADARQNADKHADDAGAQKIAARLAQFRPGHGDIFQIAARNDVFPCALLHFPKSRGEHKQADHGRYG